MCDMTHSHLWHDLFICVAWLIDRCKMTHQGHAGRHPEVSCMWYVSCLWHVTHENESCHTYASVMCVTWRMRMYDMTHSHKWHVTVTHAYVWHEWHVTHENESCHTYACVMSHIRMRHVTHMTESCSMPMSHCLDALHVTHMTESCSMHWYMWRVVCIHTCDTESCSIHWYMWHVKRHSHVWHVRRQGSVTCAYDMTQSYMWHVRRQDNLATHPQVLFHISSSRDTHTNTRTQTHDTHTKTRL